MKLSENKRFWIWLNSLHLKQSTQNKLIAELQTPQEIFDAAGKNLHIFDFLSSQEKIKLKQCANDSYILDIINTLQKVGIETISRDELDYPAQLHQVYAPPPILYFRGKGLPDENQICLCVVGCRKPTQYGQKIAFQFASELAEIGLCIASGLALGIDAMAHYGALQTRKQKCTIAILSGGLDQIYPPEHMHLAEEIEQYGCLISENAPGYVVKRYSTPFRNRLLAGFSHGVWLVEASFQSGTRYTIDAALETGKEVFALPGAITEQMAEFPNYLIQSGAHTVIQSNDIFEVLSRSTLRYQPSISIEMDQMNNANKATNSEIDKIKARAGNNTHSKELGNDSVQKPISRIKRSLEIEKNWLADDSFCNEEKQILNLLFEENYNTDQLCERVNLPVFQLLAYLTKLEQKNMIQKEEHSNAFYILPKQE